MANSLHGVMTGFYQLMAFRFLLGEGGCFPGAAKTVYEWFGKKERALANGIAIGGSAIGAVLAPPLTMWISTSMGWRWSFVIPGLVGIVWVLVWLLVPWRKKREAEVPAAVIVEKEEKAPSVPFLTLLKNKQVQIFVLVRFMLDPVFYFLMFWVPKYLNQERGVSFERVGELFWIPFLALGLSNILIGWFSDKLIARGLSVNVARKSVMGLAAAITMVAPFIAWVSSAELAIMLMAVMMLAHGLWITNYITAISDIFGRYATSMVVGLSGTAEPCLVGW